MIGYSYIKILFNRYLNIKVCNDSLLVDYNYVKKFNYLIINRKLTVARY